MEQEELVKILTMRNSYALANNNVEAQKLLEQ